MIVLAIKVIFLGKLDWSSDCPTLSVRPTDWLKAIVHNISITGEAIKLIFGVTIFQYGYHLVIGIILIHPGKKGEEVEGLLVTLSL